MTVGCGGRAGGGAGTFLWRLTHGRGAAQGDERAFIQGFQKPGQPSAASRTLPMAVLPPPAAPCDKAEVEGRHALATRSFSSAWASLRCSSSSPSSARSSRLVRSGAPCSSWMERSLLPPTYLYGTRLCASTATQGHRPSSPLVPPAPLPRCCCSPTRASEGVNTPAAAQG